MVKTTYGEVAIQSKIQFVVTTKTHEIFFRAYVTKEDGLYFMPISVVKIGGNKIYKAYHFLRSHMSTIREVAYELRQGNHLIKLDADGKEIK